MALSPFSFLLPLHLDWEKKCDIFSDEKAIDDVRETVTALEVNGDLTPSDPSPGKVCLIFCKTTNFRISYIESTYCQKLKSVVL